MIQPQSGSTGIRPVHAFVVVGTLVVAAVVAFAALHFVVGLLWFVVSLSSSSRSCSPSRRWSCATPVASGASPGVDSSCAAATSSPTPIDELADFFGAARAPGFDREWPADYNIAPTRTVLCLAAGAEGGHVLATYRWGLIPPWAKEPSVGSRLFNARGETVAVKPSFRAAFKARRLAVVSDGFFEWRRGAGLAVSRTS